MGLFLSFLVIAAVPPEPIGLGGEARVATPIVLAVAVDAKSSAGNPDSQSSLPRTNTPDVPKQPPSELDDLRRRLQTLEQRLQGAGQSTPPLSATDGCPPSQPAAANTPVQEAGKDQGYDGWTKTSADGNFQLRLGGRLHIDTAWYQVPGPVQDLVSFPFEDGVSLRRARLEADGKLWKYFDFALHADIARSSDLRNSREDPDPNIYITNAWVSATDLFFPGTVRIGHQKEALTFAAATSSKYMPFMERPAVYDALNDDFLYGTGVAVSNSWFDQRLTAWAGLFKPGSRTGGFSVGDGKYAVDGRLHVFPVYDESKQKWLYFGMAGSFRNELNDENQITVRPEVRAGSRFQVPILIDTGELFSQSGIEVFAIGSYAARGPLTIGGEYMGTYQQAAYVGGLPDAFGQLPPGARPVGNLFFQGFYVEVLYFLTPGDHHKADRVAGGFDRVKPVSNLRPLWNPTEGQGTGLGAWEVGIRYDRFDANTAGIRAGTTDSLSVGINWYWNPNARLVTNYVYTRLTTGTGENGPIHALGMRLAVDF